MRAAVYFAALSLTTCLGTTALRGQGVEADSEALRKDLAETRAELARANARSEAAIAELEETRALLRRLEQRVVRIETARAGGGDEKTDTATGLKAGTADSAPTGSTKTRYSWQETPQIPTGSVDPGGVTKSAAAFNLEAGTGGGRASFTLGFGRETARPVEGEGGLVATDQSVEIVLSAPLAKEGDTTIATLDSLTKGTKLEIGWTLFQGRVPGYAYDRDDEIMQRARQRCHDRSPPYEGGCVGVDDDFLATFMTPREREIYENGYADVSLRKSWAFGLHGAVGYDEFEYFPFPSLTKEKDEKLSWEAGASFTFFPQIVPNTTSSVSFGADYQQAYEAAKTETACPVSMVPDTVRCATGPLAPPTETEKLLLSAEVRQPIYDGIGGFIESLGIAPKVEFDALSDDYSVDVPVYVVPDKDGNLTGGFRLGYTSDEDEFIAGIFIGAKFGLKDIAR